MIQVDNLSKSYGKKMALDHITASIHDEHIFGLLGTNGAGKSTFLKILSGILKPDSGTVIIDDHPVFENELTKADICFLSDNPYFFPNATPYRYSGKNQRFFKRNEKTSLYFARHLCKHKISFL